MALRAASRFLSGNLLRPFAYQTLIVRSVYEGGEQLQGEIKRSGEHCLNKVYLIGRLGKDPKMLGSEERHIVSFSLCTNSNQHERQEDGSFIAVESKPQWHNIVVKKRGLKTLALNNLKSGARIMVSGAVEYRDVPETEEFPYKRSYTNITADEIIIFWSPRRTNTADSSESFSFDDEQDRF